MDREVVIKKLEKLAPGHKIAILVSAVTLIGIGYWYLFYTPLTNQMDKLSTDIKAADEEITKQKIVLKKMPKLEEDLQIALKHFQFAKALLPEDSVEKERLLASIEKLGKDEGVEFLLFQPGAEQRTGFYATTSIQLNMNGDFHSLMRFFSRMSGLDRLVSLETLTLSPQARKGDGQIPLAATSKILLYRALTEAEMKPEVGKKEGKGKKGE